jgi:hypothetical protein
MRRSVTGLVALAACSPTYAPPVHTVQGGAPRPAFESFMVDVADVDAVIPGAAGRIPVTRHLAVEVGGDVAGRFSRDIEANWKMAHGGLCAASAVGGGALDVELGGGIGSGGVYRSADRDGSDGSSALAWGGYLGGGYGRHGELVGAFIRTRAQLSASRDDRLPLTRWGSAALGIQIGTDSGPRFRVAAGVLAYDNQRDAGAAPLVEIGLELGGGPPPPPLVERPPARWHLFRHNRFRRRR